jgi:hypothetical protein
MLALGLFRPVLALSLGEIILIGILLAVIMFLLLKWVLKTAQSSLGGSTPTPPPPPPPVYVPTLTELQTLLKKIQDAGSASGDDCPELRRLLQKAKDESAPANVTDPLQKLIDEVCAG